jgi:hypothetical protein
MDIAKCSDDGAFYSAIDFSRLLPNDLIRKRHSLQCPACGGPAFFRQASPIGRAACFGARPHAPGCQLAAQECADEDQDAMHAPGGKIVVDFGYGSPTRPESVDSFRQAHNSDHVIHSLSDGYRPHVRRLSSLLRTLIAFPAFSDSEQFIVIEGYGEIAARDFFVQIESATSHDSGQLRGFWGAITDAQFAKDQSLWLNSSGRSNMSFCLDSKYVNVITQRHRIDNLEGFAGAYILVIGTPRVSPTGKLHLIISGPEFIALRHLDAFGR